MEYLSLVLVGIIGWLLFRKSPAEQASKIEEQKTENKIKIQVLKKEEETLKETIIMQQKDATEEQKQQFWKEYVKKDSN